MPRVSVVLPVKNGEKTIEATVKSVLLQSYDDFNLIIVDDNSTDKTDSIVEELRSRDPRIRFIKSNAQGRIFARNLGIAQTDSEYIAAMDADDICMPDRLLQQTNYMDADKSMAAVGSHIAWFGDKAGRPRMLTTKSECRTALKLFSPICHPTLFMRRSAFERCGKYIAERQLAEDYDLFCRLSFVGNIANIPQPLLAYNIHKKQSSQEQKGQQMRDMWETLSLYHQHLLGKEKIEKKQMAMRLISAAYELGPTHAIQSLRALRDCFRSMKDM